MLRSAPGLTAFPVRIGSELFQQARADLGERDDLVVLDPLAGAANLLPAVGLLHGVVIRELIAVDVDPIVAGIAEANLSLVGPAGLRSRVRELEPLHEQFHKESHAGAARSARNLLRLIEQRPKSPNTRAVVADSLDADGLRRAVGAAAVDISVADVPHGSLTQWINTTPEAEGLAPLHRLLTALAHVTVKDGVAVIASPKTESVDAPESWVRLRTSAVGHRRLHYFRRR